jgi:hypothetical protein
MNCRVTNGPINNLSEVRERFVDRYKNRSGSRKTDDDSAIRKCRRDISELESQGLIRTEGSLVWITMAGLAGTLREPNSDNLGRWYETLQPALGLAE